MKKIVLIMAAAVLGTVSANAQFYVGGSLGYSTTTDEPTGGENTTRTTLTIAPELGFALSEKLEIGLEFGFESETEKKG